MLWYHYVFGAVLILASIIITIVVLMQEGRSQNLSVLSPAVQRPFWANPRAERLRQS